MRRTHMLAAQKETATASTTSKESAIYSVKSSGIDLNRYRYHEVSQQSLDGFTRSRPSRSLRVALPRRQSKEVLSYDSLHQNPAKAGIFQKLKAKKQQRETSTVELKTELTKRTKRNELAMNAKSIVYEDMYMTIDSAPKQADGDKGLRTLRQDVDQGKESAIEGNKPKRTAAQRWALLRTAVRMGGFYKSVQKQQKFITMQDVLKRVKKQKKRIPKLPKVQKPVRAQKFMIACQPDPLVQKILDGKQKESKETKETKESKAIVVKPAKTTLPNVISEPTLPDAKKRISFMVSSHQTPNESAVSLKSPTVVQSNTPIITTVSKKPLKPRNVSMDVATTSPRNISKPHFVSSGSIFKASGIFDDSLPMHLADKVHQEKLLRFRGGHEVRNEIEPSETEADPPIKLSEAIAAILQDTDDTEAVLVISPMHGESLQNPTYLQITVVNFLEASVLGYFLVPADRTMTADEERTFSQHFCISITKDFESFESDLISILNYLSAFIPHSSARKRDTLTTAEIRKAAKAELDEIFARDPDPDIVFSRARREEMQVYVYPDFLAQESALICDFFSPYGRYLFSHKFREREVLQQLDQNPEMMDRVDIVEDVVDIMFPTPCVSKKILRGFESVTKTLRIVPVYDYLCQVLYACYRRLA